ncbi:MAG: hypothetical protein ACQET8_22605 [Bacillota bacterium]
MFNWFKKKVEVNEFEDTKKNFNEMQKNLNDLWDNVQLMVKQVDEMKSILNKKEDITNEMREVLLEVQKQKGIRQLVLAADIDYKDACKIAETAIDGLSEINKEMNLMESSDIKTEVLSNHHQEEIEQLKEEQA